MGTTTIFGRRSFFQTSSASALALGWFALGATGCNEELQKDTATFLDALEHGDHGAFKSVAAKSLQDSYSEQDFLQLSALYQMLGKLKDKTRTQTKVRNGTRSIDYTLTMERGDVHLYVSTQGDDNIESFKFDGKGWDQAAERLLEDRVGKLIDAAVAKDSAALGALLTDDAKQEVDEKSAGIFAVVAPAGARKSISSLEPGKGTAVVECENGSFEVKINMKGGKLSAFNIVPK